MNCVRTIRAAVAAAAVVSLLTGCVTVAEFRKLERDVRDLERGGAPDAGGGGGTRLADLAARLDSLEREVEAQRGRMEVVEHQTQQALEEARAARSAAASSAPAGVAPGPTGPDPDGGVPSGVGADELEAYRSARAAWSEGQAETCIDRFRNFLQTYPSSTFAENASYWMADCYFMRGDYKTAILRFDDVVKDHPEGERAPDALYRQGEALLKLGPRYGKAASKAFERVIDEYPESTRAAEAKKQLELLGSG
jgi:tol-pal system protein YbgF